MHGCGGNILNLGIGPNLLAFPREILVCAMIFLKTKEKTYFKERGKGWPKDSLPVLKNPVMSMRMDELSDQGSPEATSSGD